MKVKHDEPHGARRVREYPPLSEFADALYWAERGDRSKLDDWLARCDAVKAKYPKPQA